MNRRVMSLLLTLSLLLGLLPTAAFAAGSSPGTKEGTEEAGLAEDTAYQAAHDTVPVALTAETRDAHTSHQACGTTTCPGHPDPLYQDDSTKNVSHNESTIVWQELSSATTEEFLGRAKKYRDEVTDREKRTAQYWYYYLSEDLTIDGNGWVLDGFLSTSDDQTAYYTICLNGHTITCSTDAGKPAIKVGGSEEKEGYHAVLNICDCGGGGMIKLSGSNDAPAIRVTEGSIMNLYGGTITGEGEKGTGVFVYGGGPVHNEIIPDANGYRCHFVYSALFHMNGGKITKTEIGVDNEGRFAMTGGEISENGTGVRYQEKCYVGKDYDGDSKPGTGLMDSESVYFNLGGGAVIKSNTKADLNPVSCTVKLGKSGATYTEVVGPRVTLMPGSGEPKWVPMKLHYDGTMKNKTAITDDNKADYSRYFISDQYAVGSFQCTTTNGDNRDFTYPYGADGQLKQAPYYLVRLLGNSEDPQITVTDQPSAPTLTEGQSPAGQELKVTASGGSSTLTYQWYYSEDNTTNYTDTSVVDKVSSSNGGNTSTCTIPKLEAGKTYYFFCVITDNNNHVKIAGPVEIVFPELGELQITSQPTLSELEDGKGPKGQKLSVTADGGSGSYGYKWYWNNKKSTEGATSEYDATEAEYTIASYSRYSNNPMYFYCVVTDTDTQKTVTTDFVEVNFGPRITQQPTAPAGDPVGKTMTVEADKPGTTGKLKYQWYSSDTAEPGSGTPIYPDGTDKTLTIPDLGSGDKYIYCVITYTDGSIKTTTDVVKVNFSGEVIEPPVIDTQPAAPSVPEGQSPVGQTITAPAVTGGGGGYMYQWYYNTADSTSGGTAVSPDGTSASCKIPKLDPGTYYFYCVVTGADGGEAVTNTVKIVIPDSAGLEPGQTITLDDGTEIKRTGDGGTVTITKPGGSPVTTVTLPDNNKKGEVSVNKKTGEVIPPEGSKVTTTTTGGSGKEPEITLGGGGGSVVPGGEVKLPEDGDATVDNGQDGSGNEKPDTTITGGSGGTTVTPTDDGKVDVGKGGTVATGGTNGETGTPVNLPKGGSVTPGSGEVVPKDNLIATGEDTNGDGVPDTLIVLPSGDNKVTPGADGGVTLPGGTQVQGGGANGSDGTDGTGGANVTLPSGGTIGSGGGVKPGGDGKVTTGADGKTEVTLPTGGELKGDGEGGLTVPSGTTVKNDTGGSTVTVGGTGGSGGTGGGNGGTLDKDGGVKIPEGGVATVDNGQDGTGKDKPDTTITGGSGGSTITPNPDGTTGVTGGTTVKTGDNGTEVTVNDNGGKGGTVTTDGGIQLPGGGSVTVGGGSGSGSGGGQGGTTITVPADGTGGTGTTVQPGDGGKVTAPEGSKVKTETGGGSTPGGGQSGTEITLPKGGEVDAKDGAIKPTDGVAGVDTDGDGKPDTLIIVPSGGGSGSGDGTIKPNDQGGVDVPGGTELAGTTDGTTPAGQGKVVLGSEGGSVNGEGGVDLPAGGTATVDNGTGKTNSEITAGENGGTVKPNPDGSADVSGSGTTIQVGGGSGSKPPVTVDDKGGTVKDTGDIELKDGASATVGGEDGKSGTTITAPGNQGGTTGSTTVTPKDDGTVDVGSGGTVTTGGKNGETGTPVTLPSGGSVKPEDGAITPTGGVAGVDTDGDGKPNTLITLPSGGSGDGTIKPNDQGGVDVPGGTELKGTGDGTGTDSQSKVILGDQGGSLNGEGGVDLPKDGTATVDNGTDESGNAKPKTEITAGENGGTVKPNSDGSSADVSGSGTTIQVGGEGSTKPPVTVDDKGGTVKDTGEIELKDGASATVGGGDGKPGTTITAPKDQGDTAGSTTVTPKDDGTVDVGSGGTVTTGGKNGETGTPVTLPSGGSVKPEDGTIKPVDNTIATGEDENGDGIPDTVIVLPESSSSTGITPGEDGGIKLPGGSTIQGGDGLSTTLPEGGELTPEGGVKPSGNTLTIEGEDGKPGVTIKLPEDGAVSGSGDGGLRVPQDTEIKQSGGNTPSVVVGENGGSVGKDGKVTLPAGGSATITGSNGTDSITVNTPQGGQVNTADGSTSAPEVEINGTTVTAPTGETVTTNQAGSTQAGPGTVIKKGDTQVTVSEGAATVDKDGNLTFPNGGKVEVTKNGVTQTVTVPSGGTIKPPDYSSPTSNSGSQSGSGSSGDDSDTGSTYAPSIKQPEHGTIKVSPSFPIAGDRVSIIITPEKGYKVDTVTVTDRNGKSITVTKQADGIYTFIQPAGGVTVSAVMKAADGSCSQDSSCPIHAFADMDVTAWYHDGVHYCLEEGLMKGYENGTFGPQNSLSRAMLAQILYRRAGCPAVSGHSPFDDVVPDAWYTDAITWAADSGVAGGYDNGKFGPDDPITREQLAAMLYRCAKARGEDVLMGEDGSLLKYKDHGEISEYAIPALQWAVGSGIVNGKGDGILDPTGRATRAEAATMLMRFCEIADR